MDIEEKLVKLTFLFFMLTWENGHMYKFRKLFFYRQRQIVTILYHIQTDFYFSYAIGAENYTITFFKK